MTSREIVKRCVHFGKPPRPGVFRSRFAESDLTIVYDFFRKDADGFDPWGIQWARADEPVTTVGIPKTPPLKDESEIGRVKAPDAQLHARGVKENLRQLYGREQDKYRVIATSSGIWERVQYFRGMDDLMVTKLIPEFISVGMDLVNPYQSQLCGFRDVAQYAGKLAFMSTVNSQGALNGASEPEIRAACAQLATWGTPDGGLLISPSVFEAAEETERIMHDFFIREG